jgi:hypothetical protein
MIELGAEVMVADAVVRLLRAKGDDALAATVSVSKLERVPGDETWTLDHRPVEAHRFVLVVTPESFAKLREHADSLEVLREALASVVDTPSTRLAGLSLVIALGAPGAPASAAPPTWGSVYRTSAPSPEGAADPDGVRRAAAALANAYGDAISARMLADAELTRADLFDNGAITTVRWIVHLSPEDLVAAERSTALGDRIIRCVTHAATRAAERVGEIELRAKAADVDR